jgi:hypothetical protein
MHFQIEVTPPSGALVAIQPPPPPEAPTDMLRQLVDLQKQQVMILRAMYAQHDSNIRWKSLLARWQEEFPEVGDSCKQSIPTIERSYLRLVEELTQKLQDEEAEGGLDNDYALSEFLDRYAVRISQLGTMLNLIGPLADAARKEEKND